MTKQNHTQNFCSLHEELILKLCQVWYKIEDNYHEKGALL